MSHPDTENLEPQEPAEAEDEAVEELAESSSENSEPEAEKAEPELEVEPAEAEAPSEPEPPATPAVPKDHRMSRLMKMQSQYVTEAAIKATEESAKPKPPPAPEVPAEEEFFDDEEHFDEEFDEDEEFEDDDFEDDDYEEDEGLEPTAPPDPSQEGPAAQDTPPEPEVVEEPEEDEGDHRVAQLRKLRKQFVSEKDLEKIKDAPASQQVYKEVKVQKVLCPNCQSEEIRTHKMCSNCGAKLPNITSVQEETYNPGTMNAAVLKYVNAVKKLSDGDWSAEDFEEFLHDRQVLTQTYIDDLHELVEECGSQEWLPDATKLLFESTALLEDTLEIMLTKVDEVRAQQADLEAEFDIQMSEYEVFLESEEELDFEMDPPEAPDPVEDRIRRISFKADLSDIEKSNNLLLNTLKLIDAFQREGPEDISL